MGTDKNPADGTRIVAIINRGVIIKVLGLLCVMAVVLRLCLGGADAETTMTSTNDATLADVAQRLRSEFHEGLYARTYRSLLNRVDASGYFQESVTGAYQGMFPRTVGGLVSLFVETGEMERSRRLVDVVLRATKANDMLRAPHVMGRPQVVNEPLPGSNCVVSTERSVALYRLDGPDYQGVQEFVAPAGALRAVKAWLSCNNGNGVLTCSITANLDDKAPLAEASVPLRELAPSGGWIRFQLSKPVRLISGQRYFLHLQSIGKGIPIWWGLDAVAGHPLAGAHAHDPGHWLHHPDHVTAFALDTGKLRHVKRESFPILAREDQIDGNFHVLLAWALVVLHSNVRAWENATYPQIARMTDVAIDWPYLTPKGDQPISRIFVGLVHNFCFEHSREGRFWDCWDLLTQSFACQALRLLTQVAERRGDREHSQRWRSTYTAIERTVEERLTVEIDGQRIYAEMRLPDGGAGKLFDGLSWVNLAPVAAQWEGADRDRLRNTIHTLRNKATFAWRGHALLGCEWNSDGSIARYVIGKGVGWDMVYALQEKDWGRICRWLDFVRDANHALVYAEAFGTQPDGTVQLGDPGNGEQCSWWCWAMAKVRKAAGLPAAPR